jgi:hypothetical protein
VCGDRPLSDEFDRASIGIKPRATARFFREAQQERGAPPKFGDSVYLLEPQLKEGAGWPARPAHRAVDQDQIQGDGCASSRQG